MLLKLNVSDVVVLVGHGGAHVDILEYGKELRSVKWCKTEK
jgi:hypothetical protein